MTQAPLVRDEWLALNELHERYEHGALWLKLGALAVVVGGRGAQLSWLLLGLALLVLWLVEAMYRTSQARLSERLLVLERLLGAGQPEGGMQLYSEWERVRPGAAGLLVEYAAHARRPTVAVVYMLLLLLCTLQWWRY